MFGELFNTYLVITSMILLRILIFNSKNYYLIFTNIK